MSFQVKNGEMVQGARKSSQKEKEGKEGKEIFFFFFSFSVPRVLLTIVEKPKLWDGHWERGAGVTILHEL